MVLWAIMFKSYILLVQCRRTVSTLAGPSEYFSNWFRGPPGCVFLFVPLHSANIHPLICSMSLIQSDTCIFFTEHGWMFCEKQPAIYIQYQLDIIMTTPGKNE